MTVLTPWGKRYQCKKIPGALTIIAYNEIKEINEEENRISSDENSKASKYDTILDGYARVAI